jgi:hypothetical protein
LAARQNRNLSGTEKEWRRRMEEIQSKREGHYRMPTIDLRGVRAWMKMVEMAGPIAMLIMLCSKSGSRRKFLGKGRNSFPT